MAGEFKTVRKGHEMTNRKMFFTMLWGAVNDNLSSIELGSSN